jgi:ubiquitin carboxyl-terminal hydrolase 14
MNSCIQVLRSIPELQDALQQCVRPRSPLARSPCRADSLTYRYPGTLDAARGTGGALTASLRDLYRDLGNTSTYYPPMLFWQVLRQHVPQFQEMREGHPAQQDAQECWIQVLQALKQNLDANANAAGASNGSGPVASREEAIRSRFVQRFMTGEMRSECVRLPMSSMSRLDERRTG